MYNCVYADIYVLYKDTLWFNKTKQKKYFLRMPYNINDITFI